MTLGLSPDDVLWAFPLVWLKQVSLIYASGQRRQEGWTNP